MARPRHGYGSTMTEQQGGDGRDPGPGPHDQEPDARPTTNQPLHGEPRPRFTPLAVTVAILALVLVVILALTLL
jgi:hypothetical protein